jgi:hypothetical protein
MIEQESLGTCGLMHGPIPAEPRRVEMEVHVMAFHRAFDSFT